MHNIWQQKWVVGNWKMNGSSRNNADLLAQLAALPTADRVHIGVAAPFVYLPQVHGLLQQSEHNRITLCAQDVSRFSGSGAYTGEVSAQMLHDIGVQTVLVGHSERGQYFGEDNAVRRQKLENVLAAGLTPLLCVGESLAQRESGREQETVAEQLAVLKGLDTQSFAVAYEPVWAIGTGKTATAEQIADMHRFIYSQVLSVGGDGANIRILYGGSVNEKNAAEIFSVPHVDGALVGGASLKYEPFAAIINAAQETQ